MWGGGHSMKEVGEEHYMLCHNVERPSAENSNGCSNWDFLSNVTKWTRAREETVWRIPFCYCESFFVSLYQEMGLPEVTGETLGDGRGGRPMITQWGPIQNHKWCYFSFLGLLIQITKGRACPVFTVDAPLVSPLLTDEFWSHNGQHLYFSGGFPTQAPLSCFFLESFLCLGVWVRGVKWQRSLLSSQVGWPVMRRLSLRVRS